MRLISWNVNGIRAVLKKDFEDIFATFNADVFGIQEIKCQKGQVKLDFPGYLSFWSYAQRPGYAGTAAFCKTAPRQVLHGIGLPYLDAEGRVCALEFDDFWFVCVYTPNAQDGLARIDVRMEWDDAFRAFCKGLEEGVLPVGVPVERPVAVAGDAAQVEEDAEASGAQAAEAKAEAEADDSSEATDDIDPLTWARAFYQPAEGFEVFITEPGETCDPKPVVMCGDFNVAHNEIDLKNPGPNRGNAGFSDEERGKFTELVEAGFVDTFRTLNPDAAGKYSWWSYRGRARQNNTGWRIDYFLVSEPFFGHVEDAAIYAEVMGSDHCPVGLELK